MPGSVTMSSVVCAFFALLFGFICATIATMYGVVGRYEAAIFCLSLAALSGIMVAIIMRYERAIDQQCGACGRSSCLFLSTGSDVIHVTVLRREPEPREFSRSKTALLDP